MSAVGEDQENKMQALLHEIRQTLAHLRHGAGFTLITAGIPGFRLGSTVPKFIHDFRNVAPARRTGVVAATLEGCA